MKKKIEKALEDVEEVYIELYKITGESKNINKLLNIPKDIDKYIKEKLYNKNKNIITERYGMYWSKEEDEQLKKEFESTISIKKMAENHGRTEYAIKKRLELFMCKNVI